MEISEYQPPPPPPPPRPPSVKAPRKIRTRLIACGLLVVAFVTTLLVSGRHEITEMFSHEEVQVAAREVPANDSAPAVASINRPNKQAAKETSQTAAMPASVFQ